MSIFNKALEKITNSDIEELVLNQVRESKTIDYKRILPEDNDRSKKEFLADVASFANAGGGDLVYGVVENHGVPSRVAGIKLKDVEQEMLRLEHIIRDGINPRIYGVTVREIQFKDRYVVVVRIPRSWSAPHMVSYQGYGKFFSRNSYGKHPLDASEIRVAFSLSQQNIDYLRDFRMRRIGKIIAGDVPVQPEETSKLVVHFIPFSINNPTLSIDISRLGEGDLMPKSIFGNEVVHHRFNYEGFVQHSDTSYIQMFRNGAVEMVESNFLSFAKGKSFINPEYEQSILEQVDELLTFMQRVRIEPPFLVMISMLGVKGAYMGKSSQFHWYKDSMPIEHRDLLLPEAVIEDYNTVLPNALKSVFFSVWNAAGWPRSMNYNEEGHWSGLEL